MILAAGGPPEPVVWSADGTEVAENERVLSGRVE